MAGGAAPTPALVLALALLCLLLAASPGRPSGDVYLYAGRHPALPSGHPTAIHTVIGQPSVACVLSEPRAMYFHEQVDSLDAQPETRWGSFFSREPMYFTFGSGPDPPAERVVDLLPIPGQQLPVVVHHTRQWIGFFASPDRWNLPSSDVEVLACNARLDSRVSCVGLHPAPAGNPRQVYYGVLREGGLEQISMNLSLPPGPVLAAPSIEGNFLLASGQKLISLFTMFDGTGVHLETPLASPIHQLACTWAVSSPDTCPDSGDAVVLLANGEVHILPCHRTFAANPPPGVVGRLPAGLSASTTRLVPPPGVKTLDQPLRHLYFLDMAAPASPRIWRADVLPDELLWRRVIPPARVTSLADVTLARLRMSGSPAPGAWALVAQGMALFDSQALRCGQDPSIVCDGADLASGSPDGWACAGARAEAPFVSTSQLCAGCADGHFLDRPSPGPPFAHPSHSCQPCPYAGCRECDRMECLACQQGLFLEPSGPAGSMVCVGACSSGFALLAGVCQPANSLAPRTGLGPPAPVSPPGIGPEVTISALGPTRLRVDSATGMPVIPAVGAAPANALLLTSQPGTLLLPVAELEGLDQATPVPVHLLQPGAGLRPWVSFAEVGPLHHAGHLLLGIIFLDAEGDTFEAWLSCATPDPATACSPSAPVAAHATGFQPMLEVRRLDEASLLLSSASEGILLRAAPASGGFSRTYFSASATLPLAEGWLLQMRDFRRAAAGPQTLLQDLDSRWPGLDGQLLEVTSLPGAHVPVLLPRGGGPAGPGPELVLVSLQAHASWAVLRAPGGLPPDGPAGRLALVPQGLGPLPRPLAPGPGPGQHVRVLGVQLHGQGADFPSALLLLTRTFFAVSLLRCPAAGGACALLPAVVTGLPAWAHLPEDAPFWSEPIIHPPGPATTASPATKLLTLLLCSTTTGPLSVALESACPPDTFGLGCTPCDAACRGCSGPGVAGCSACRAWLPGSPAACLAACPTGLHADPAGECACHDTCRTCEPTPPGSGTYTCKACMAGHVLAPGGASPDRCLACDGTCAECALPGDSEACTACSGQRWLLGGACIEQCPASMWPDAGARACRACPAGCTGCTSDTQCTGCAERHFHGQDGLCHACDGSCARCDARASCTACRAGLIFLSVDPQVPSLCGSTCAPGELVADARCQACDASCALCSGAPDACQ
ncbi:hypothetical protein H696_06257, partial [Fonticula alba]